MSRRLSKEKLRQRRRRERIRSLLLWSALTAIVLTAIAGLVWPAVRPAAGEAVPLMPGRNHVPLGEDPGPLNSNPPTSGPHYSSPLRPGFYDETAADDIGPYPEGHLLHNLEHGYSVLWYNCDQLDAASCSQLKAQIQGVIDEVPNTKVIAFPWNIPDAPVVMTSWGRMQRFDRFDPRVAARFVKTNWNRAPEWQAP